MTDVLEDNIRTFATHWTGTGAITGAGDDERIELESGEYMESEIVHTGEYTVELLQNNYKVGNDVQLRYRHADSQANCLLAGWQDYAAPFDSDGYVQIRLDSTL